jgi:hypothetical protein
LDLEECLQSFGLPRSAVRTIWSLQFGCLAFRRKRSKRSENPDGPDATPSDPDPGEIWGALLDQLQIHEYIYELKRLDDWDYPTFTFSRLGYLLSVGTAMMRVQIPTKEQKFAGMPSDPPPASFQVVSAGSLYCAYTVVADVPAYNHIGAEYRFFLEAITKDASYPLRTIGPSPIHPETYLIRADGLPQSYKAIRESKDQVFLLVSADAPEAALMSWVLRDVSLALTRFYQVAAIRDRMLGIVQRVEIAFRRLAHLLRERVAAQWWDVMRTYQLGREAQIRLNGIYESLFGLQRLQLECKELADDALDNTRELEVLSPHAGYIDRMMARSIPLPDSLIPATAHFSEQVRSTDSSQVAIIASLLGAVAGAILGAYLKK